MNQTGGIRCQQRKGVGRKRFEVVARAKEHRSWAETWQGSTTATTTGP